MRRLLLAAVLVAAVPGAALADTTTHVTAAAPVAPVPPADGVIAAGVTIGGIPVGGMTTTQARNAIGAAYQAPISFTLGKHHFRAPAKRLGLHVYVNNPVRVAYNVGRLPTAPTGDIPVVTRIVGSKLDSYVAMLAQRYNRKPVDAKVVLKGGTPYTWSDEWGRTIDKASARAAIADALRNPRHPTVTVPTKPVKPAVTARKLPDSILIDRGKHTLTLYKDNKVVRRFPVAVGQSIYPTPTGSFHIIIKEENPWWYPPTGDAWAAGLKPVPPGPDNPLGTRWMGIDSPGVGIHGTDAPASIGYSESHGCIRMQVPDAEWVFGHVVVGTPVWIVD